MEIRANLKNLRLAPRKARLVADLIRGLKIEVAQNQLEALNKKAAQPFLKLLQSAVANAEHNFKLEKDNLYIAKLMVDQGTVLKRWMPKAMGRATPIHKKNSHVTLVLDELKKELKGKAEIKEAAKDKKEAKKKDLGDVKVVQSLEEIKTIGKKEKIKQEAEIKTSEEHKAEIKDARMEGKDRGKQNLDKLRKKSKGGILKRVFRRKAV